ncbi:uncharacterized protein [Malus domestica]|uniref:uncharacterized protein isoform X3 n=1 Tax=Malus domestica TaxID=3750 RepID=UPI0039768F51
MFEALVHKVVQQRGQGGSAFCEGNFVYKIRIEIVVSKDQSKEYVTRLAPSLRAIDAKPKARMGTNMESMPKSHICS